MTDNVTAAELLQFIERAEQLAAEKKEITDQEKELRAELTGRGYDAKAFREVLRLRKMAPDARTEFEAVVQMYRDAAGMQ
jgi:uncharacterized protein (UPF0335 family)